MNSNSASPRYESLLKECETGLRAGRGQLLRNRLASVNSSRIPRQYRHPIANLCRRAGLNQTGLRILSPIVHPARKISAIPASSAELAEYALLLSRIGLVQEAFWTLEQVNTIEAPEADLFRSHFHFSRWEYIQALPFLEKYLSGDLPPYARLIGNVNLAAALVQTASYDQALNQINENIEIAKKEQHRRLWLNSLELKTELYVQSDKFDDARRTLTEADSLIDENQVAVDAFYVSIWRAILDGLESSNLAPLLSVREEAQARGLWERVREIDLYLCKVENRKSQLNRDRFDFLIFGTPYPAFREKAFNAVGVRTESDTYIFGDKEAPCVDITAGNLKGLKPGKKVHQVLDVVLRDFYRPASVGALFSELYPTERFDIESSPSRVHQVLCRTRSWLSENRIPAVLKTENNGVQLHLTKSRSPSTAVSFRVPLDRKDLSTFRSQWMKLE